MRERDQPSPLAASRRKKGSGTSNHTSRAPNRKTRDRERMLMFGLFLRRKWQGWGAGAET